MDKEKDLLKQAEEILTKIESSSASLDMKQNFYTLSLAYSMLSAAKSLESIDNSLKKIAIRDNTKTFGSGIINL